MKASIPELIETERLIIRCPVLSDLDDIYEAIQSSMNELMPWMPWASRTALKSDFEENLRQAIAKFVTKVDLRYHFHDKETGAFLVGSGLHQIDWAVPKFEIGYWCKTSAQGKGYVTEGVRALSQMAFTDLKASRVEIRCDEKNLKSFAVAERLGYTLEGTLKHDSISPEGDLRSTKIYALTDLSDLIG